MNTWSVPDSAPGANEKNVWPSKRYIRIHIVLLFFRDLESFYFATMEEYSGALTHFPDDWLRRPSDCVPQAVVTTAINPEQKGIDGWRANHAPDAHSTISPFVENYMLTSAIDGSDNSTSSQMREQCMAGHRPLIEDGRKADEQYARAAWLLMGKPTSGISGRVRISAMWGAKSQFIDYTARPLQIGSLHFPVVYMRTY